MMENFRSEHYQDGSAITTGLGTFLWQTTTTGAYSIYDDNAANKTAFGLLYNWHAVNDPRGLCPLGWHVPTDDEWTSLILSIDPVACTSCSPDQSLIAGSDLKASSSDFPAWNGSNLSGFSGLPGGYRWYFSGGYIGLNVDGYWWTSEQNTSSTAWFRRLTDTNDSVIRASNSLNNGQSVRCVRD